MDAADMLVTEMFSWVKLQKDCGDKLDKLANEMEERQKNVNVSKVVGSSLSLTGAAAMTGAGIATLITGGAFGVIAVAAGATSWLGLATDASTDVVNFFVSKSTWTEAQKVVEEIEDLNKKMAKHVESLRKEAQKKGGHEGSCPDDRVTELILRAMAKRNGLRVKDCVSLKKILEEGYRKNRNKAILSSFSLSKETVMIIVNIVRKILEKSAAKATKEATKSAGGKIIGKAAGRIAGGVFGLAYSIPDLYFNCKSLDNPETEDSKILKEKAKDIRAESVEIKEELEEIENIFRGVAEFKRYFEDREADGKPSIEDAAKKCKSEIIHQWLDENKPFLTLVGMFQFV